MVPGDGRDWVFRGVVEQIVDIRLAVERDESGAGSGDTGAVSGWA